MEFVIYHDGKDWCLKNEHFFFSSPTIEELDLQVSTAMKNSGLIKKGERKKIFMAFDNSTIPQVIRQYANHYFNRIIEIEGE